MKRTLTILSAVAFAASPAFSESQKAGLKTIAIPMNSEGQMAKNPRQAAKELMKAAKHLEAAGEASYAKKLRKQATELRKTDSMAVKVVRPRKISQVAKAPCSAKGCSDKSCDAGTGMVKIVGMGNEAPKIITLEPGQDISELVKELSDGNFNAEELKAIKGIQRMEKVAPSIITLKSGQNISEVLKKASSDKSCDAGNAMVKIVGMGNEAPKIITLEPGQDISELVKELSDGNFNAKELKAIKGNQRMEKVAPNGIDVELSQQLSELLKSHSKDNPNGGEAEGILPEKFSLSIPFDSETGQPGKPVIIENFAAPQFDAEMLKKAAKGDLPENFSISIAVDPETGQLAEPKIIENFEAPQCGAKCGPKCSDSAPAAETKNDDLAEINASLKKMTRLLEKMAK